MSHALRIALAVLIAALIGFGIGRRRARLPDGIWIGIEPAELRAIALQNNSKCDIGQFQLYTTPGQSNQTEWKISFWTK